ncbi:hypothetical protein [Corynebacterium aquatimens]|uniref:Ig-like domain (Group 1) n=1 Tax=Corynebacterium aquatimens TaxID=1190508 RepID=A0A931DZF7_9CORY|nr:hypothetical protein [Corynebacterium aquatimens]MBG6122930.1 hypothetical protein [Corynebacterium aquatimens]WJY66735.1 hypothetical protein CAQUA_10240 [Corynebacterium aquatimens]
MRNQITRAVLASATAVALTGGLVAAPHAQAQGTNIKTTEMMVPIACKIQAKRTGMNVVVKRVIGAAEKTYNYSNQEDLHFKSKVTAPTTVVPGEKFDYVMDIGKVGAPKKIAIATVKRGSQMNLWIDLPSNATVEKVELKGGDPKIKARIEGNRLHFYGEGGADVTQWEVGESNDRNWKHGGLEAVDGGNLWVADMPVVTLKMKAGNTEGATIQPYFDKSDPDKFPSTAFVQVYADATGSYGPISADVSAFARCGLSENDSSNPKVPATPFPAVKIVKPAAPDRKAAAVVKVVNYKDEPVAAGTKVDITVDGTRRTVTLGAGGTATLPEETIKDGASKQVTIALADNPSVKQTVTLKGQATAQPEAERTATLKLPRGRYDATVNVTVKDFRGNPIPNAVVKVGSNDQVTANANGVATITRTLQEDQKANLRLSLADDSSVTDTVQLVGAADAKPVAVTLQKQARQVESTVNVTVVDSNGATPPAGTKVALRTEGAQPVIAETNAEGVATLKTNVTEGQTANGSVYLVEEETSSADVTLAPGKTTTAELVRTVQAEDDDTVEVTDVTRKAEVTVKRATGETLPEGTKVNLMVNGTAVEGTVDKHGKITLIRTIKSNASEALRVALAETPETVKTTRLFGASERVGQVELTMAAQEIDQAIEVTVKNADGSLSKNKTHALTVAGAERSITTDADGKATVPVKVTEGEDTTFAVALKGSDDAQSAVVTAKQGAEPAKVTLTLAPTEVTMPIEVTVKDDVGKPAANTPVEMTIGEKTLTATTDAKGTATFRPTLTEGTSAVAVISAPGGVPTSLVLGAKRDPKKLQVTVDKPAAPATNTKPTENPSTPGSTTPTPTTTTPATTTPAPRPSTPDAADPTTKNASSNADLSVLWIILGTLLAGLGLGAAAAWGAKQFNIPLPF